jgi:hypothetical protein
VPARPPCNSWAPPNPGSPRRAAPRGSSPTLGRALVRWRRIAGAFWLYVCAAPFLAGPPPRRGRGAGPEAPIDLVEVIDRLPGAAQPALLVDLPLAATLPAAPSLVAHGYSVVPVIQRWCGTADAVLPAGDLRRLLDEVARQTSPPAAPTGVVFLIDGERAGPPGTVPGRRFDNRYEYATCRFPPPELLRAQGIDLFAILSQRESALDLAEYAERLAVGGLPPLRLTLP